MASFQRRLARKARPAMSAPKRRKPRFRVGQVVASHVNNTVHRVMRLGYQHSVLGWGYQLEPDGALVWEKNLRELTKREAGR